jgi:hypothetical protein
MTAWSRVLMKYSTIMFMYGNSWSSETSKWEKQAQAACLVIQFRCLDNAVGGVSI